MRGGDYEADDRTDLLTLVRSGTLPLLAALVFGMSTAGLSIIELRATRVESIGPVISNLNEEERKVLIGSLICLRPTLHAPV